MDKKFDKLMDWLLEAEDYLLDEMPWLDDEWLEENGYEDVDEYEKDEDDYMNEGALESIRSVIDYMNILREEYDDDELN